MKINRNNYESFFLDYIEGNLSNDEIAELRVFISENRDLEDELKEFESFHIIPENLDFSEKENLKISFFSDIKITNENVAEFCIAFYENDLTPEKKLELEHFLNTHTEIRQDFLLFAKTKLKANQTVKFFDKSALLKSIENEKISHENFPDFCIAYYEKNISEKSKQKLLEYLDNHPEKLNDFNAYKQTILLPPENIVFKDKNRLKKGRIILLSRSNIIKFASTIAAMFILFFGLYNFKNKLFINPVITARVYEKQNQTEPATQQLAEITTEDKKTKPANKKNISKQVKNKRNQQDSTLKKQNKLKNLKPFTIENYHNVRFSSVQNPQKIIGNQVKIAKVEFNFKEMPDAEIPKQNTAYLTLSEYLAERAKKMILKDNYTKNKKLNYLDVAQAGIKGIDKIIPGKIEFDYKENEAGKIEYLALNTPLFDYSKEFNR
ncbi:MAG: hypothetical protein GXO79_05370 [Chlorobi bacterium]|nr:hypothetical protein [Chlorobiota bacterium]